MFLAWNFLANFSRLRSMAPWTFQKVRERTLSLLRYHPSDQFRLRRTGRTPISAILSQSPEEFRIILIFNFVCTNQHGPRKLPFFKRRRWHWWYPHFVRKNCQHRIRWLPCPSSSDDDGSDDNPRKNCKWLSTLRTQKLPACDLKTALLQVRRWL